MLYIIEGLDGAGKSKLVEKLGKYGFVTYATPPAFLKDRREKVDTLGTPEEQYAFYSEGVRIASEELISLLRKHNTVVVDRYWITTLVYHYLKGVNVNPQDFAGIIKPDLTIFLTVTYDEQIKRINGRGWSINDREMAGRYNDLKLAYEQFLPLGRYTTIDTTPLTEVEVYNKVLKLIL